MTRFGKTTQRCTLARQKGQPMIGSVFKCGLAASLGMVAVAAPAAELTLAQDGKPAATTSHDD